VLKDIKKCPSQRVYSSDGEEYAFQPRHRMKLCTIRLFTRFQKLSWIRQQQTKLPRTKNAKTPREYLDRESHYVWGKRHLLKLIEEPSAPRNRAEATTSLILRG